MMEAFNFQWLLALTQAILIVMLVLAGVGIYQVFMHVQHGRKMLTWLAVTTVFVVLFATASSFHDQYSDWLDAEETIAEYRLACKEYKHYP